MRVSYLEIVVLSACGGCDIIFGADGSVSWSLHWAFCSHVVSLFAEFVHHLCVFGAFSPHHLTSLCLTAGVNFKDSLRRQKDIFCLIAG